jgi:hypothetical protein
LGYGHACGSSFAQPEIAINRFESNVQALAATGAFAAFLNGRTRHGAVLAEHAAIACQRFQLLAAALAYIEELTGVRRHVLNGLMLAFRTGQDGFKLHRRPEGDLISGGSILFHLAATIKRKDRQ